MRIRVAGDLLTVVVLALSAVPASAHDVADGDKGYIQEVTGVHLVPFAQRADRLRRARQRPGQRVSYGTGRGVTADEGAIEAAFDGNHGWFFRNRTDAAVTVTLRTSGDYTELEKVRDWGQVVNCCFFHALTPCAATTLLTVLRWTSRYRAISASA